MNLIAHQHDSDVNLHLYQDGCTYVVEAQFVLEDERNDDGSPIFSERGTLGEMLLRMHQFWCDEYGGNPAMMRDSVFNKPV